MFSLVNIALDMNYKRIEYWAGLGFLALAVFMLAKENYWDAALYISAGMAFSLNGLLKENVFPEARKLLVILAWLFIGLTLFLFLFLLRTDK